jgi:hypothetical protein
MLTSLKKYIPRNPLALPRSQIGNMNLQTKLIQFYQPIYEPYIALQKCEKTLYISFFAFSCSNVELYSLKVPQVHLLLLLMQNFIISFWCLYFQFGSEVRLMCFWDYIFLTLETNLKLGLLISKKRENINDFLNQQFLFRKFIILENK